LKEINSNINAPAYICVGGVFLFAVLQIKQSEQGILAVMKNHLLQPQTDVKRVNIAGAQPFFIVSTTQKSGQIPWNAIEYSLGRLSGRLLLPNGVTPPINSNVKSLETTDNLSAKMLLNTAIKVSKHSEIPKQKQRITVVDRTGIYIDQIEDVIKSAAVVRVITDRIIQYEQLAKNIFYKWGASIILSTDLRFALQSDIIISPFEQITGTNSLVLSTNACRCATAKTVISPQITLPAEFSEFLPQNIDEHKFACALYDDCGLKKLAGSSFETMLFCGCEQNVFKLAQMINYETS